MLNPHQYFLQFIFAKIEIWGQANVCRNRGISNQQRTARSSFETVAPRQTCGYWILDQFIRNSDQCGHSRLKKYVTECDEYYGIYTTDNRSGIAQKRFVNVQLNESTLRKKNKVRATSNACCRL
ncbi:PREDICTED: uncharacterized protein LOC105154869 [Acromyrmex echinatior]|uniref:uncharacterized protein LOC105154869 n=1 Tax=Acromyrmex echinatior TaxID=103372 RepID=UPI000580E878|nr:PREDICTED: uncharacterized protein LOC105154869 [Acromyrmex echinatior]